MMWRSLMGAALTMGIGLSAAASADITAITQVSYGVRPFYLIDDLPKGALKTKLQSCEALPAKKSTFAIAHRGAPLQFPEHTLQSYVAAARQGAGMIECDVAFTKDKELVCRHAQNDLHTTTNILATPLAAKCTKPFEPAVYDDKGVLIKEAQAECRTSDITLAEFKTLKGKMDASNPKARTVAEYLNATPSFRTDLYAQNGTLLSHKESIELFKKLKVAMVPELKEPVVDMPFEGFSQEQYAQKLLDEYRQAKVPPSQVMFQSFLYDDIAYWLKHGGAYGKRAVFLDEELDTRARIAAMSKLKKDGLVYLAPAMPMLLTHKDGKIVPSEYARAARQNGLSLIAWSLERSPNLAGGGGWYYDSVRPLIHKDSDILQVLDVLTKDVGILGIFSDWPATVAYYANCQGL